MRQALKNYFIPHEGNGFRPHVVHTKRTLWYSALFVGLKAMLFVVALTVPSTVYLHPEVLDKQYQAIIQFTNDVRAREHKGSLGVSAKLNGSSDAKATDMARYGYFSHTGPNNRTLAYFLKQAKYQYSSAGENLAIGFSDALSVVKAWELSPTHYNNLIDHDFKEIGVGLQSGTYQGEPTIYIAQHFGTPAALTFDGEWPPKVAGQKIADEQWLTVDTKNSHVFWQIDGDNTILTVQAKIDGAVGSAEAQVGSVKIPLAPTGKENIFIGTITVAQPLESFFLPSFTLPTITAVDGAGQTTITDINWFNVPRFEPTIWAAYTRAEQFLGPVTSIFAVSRTIFALSAIFFAAALALIMAYEFRREHRHLVGQTAMMVVLLVGLWWI